MKQIVKKHVAYRSPLIDGSHRFRARETKVKLAALKPLLAISLGAGVFFDLCAAPSFALDPRMLRGLLKLDPDTRLEQVCDLEAMRQIGLTKEFHPDRAKSYVISPPQHEGDLLKAPGAAFRSSGKWYEFSMECRGARDHLKIVAFKYQIGAPIPEAKWGDYGLWR